MLDKCSDSIYRCASTQSNKKKSDIRLKVRHSNRKKQDTFNEKCDCCSSAQ